MKRKWYLSTWLISILFALWFFIIPGIIGIILLIKQIKDDNERIKMGWGDVEKAAQEKEKVQSEIDSCNKELFKLRKQLGILTEIDDATKETQKIEIELQTKIDSNHTKIEKLEQDIKRKESAIEELDETINNLKDELVVLDDELLYQSFGFYETKYDLESSEAYKQRLQEIKKQQKAMVKDKSATFFNPNWRLNNSLQQGRAMNNDNIKMALRAFNNECDVAISKVKFNNFDSIYKRIQKGYEQINKLNKRNDIQINPIYLQLKFDELHLAFEYAQKKEDEREEQARIREQMREEEKVRREIEKEKSKIQKEEAHFYQEIENLKNRAKSAKGEAKQQLEEKIRELEEKLALVQKEKEHIFNREQNTRAGYVYVISNIGSFGDSVYKIGLTRRLVPEDRVRELGDASVPFKFDIHAMIFSEDAPSLENALHKAFDHKRVNRVNNRKEFFQVRLEEIEEEVKKNHNAVVEFTKIAEAKEYRESQRIYEQKLQLHA